MEMDVNLILRMATLAIGLFFLIHDFIALVKKQMADLLAIGWLIISIVLILFGVIPVLGTWTYFVSLPTGLTLLFMVSTILFFVFRMCYWVSDLFWQNKELSMQISLLNQENIEMKERMKQVEKLLEEQKNKA